MTDSTKGMHGNRPENRSIVHNRFQMRLHVREILRNTIGPHCLGMTKRLIQWGTSQPNRYISIFASYYYWALSISVFFINFLKNMRGQCLENGTSSEWPYIKLSMWNRGFFIVKRKPRIDHGLKAVISCFNLSISRIAKTK